MPRQEGSSEGSGPTQDMSRATIEAITLNAFTKLLDVRLKTKEDIRV